MEHYNGLLLEMLCEQSMRERSRALQQLASLPDEPRERLSAVKRALASTFVRLGLRLDPAAGKGLGAFDLSLAPPEGRPHS